MDLTISRWASDNAGNQFGKPFSSRIAYRNVTAASTDERLRNNPGVSAASTVKPVRPKISARGVLLRAAPSDTSWGLCLRQKHTMPSRKARGVLVPNSPSSARQLELVHLELSLFSSSSRIRLNR